MSNFEFIIAMIVVVVAIIGVVAGLIFLVLKSKDKQKSNNKMVYISTGNGKKYHSDPFCFTHDDCNCTEIELNKAIKRGYTPCSKCIK